MRSASILLRMSCEMAHESFAVFLEHVVSDEEQQLHLGRVSSESSCGSLKAGIIQSQLSHTHTSNGTARTTVSSSIKISCTSLRIATGITLAMCRRYGRPRDPKRSSGMRWRM